MCTTINICLADNNLSLHLKLLAGASQSWHPPDVNFSSSSNISSNHSVSAMKVTLKLFTIYYNLFDFYFQFSS